VKANYVFGIVVLTAALAAVAGFYYPFGHPARVLKLPGVVEIQEVRLGSKIGGRVADVLVLEGDRLVADQELVRLEVPELEAQREQIKASLAAATALLAKLRKGPREEEIRQAQFEMETAEADLRLAREEFARIDKIHRQGGAARSEYDSARAARDRAQGQFATARARLDLLLAGTRPEEILEQEARVLEIQGRLRELEVHLHEAVVRSPGPCVVEVVSVRRGDLVAPNQALVKVLADDDLWVKVYVPETELGKVRVGERVEVYVDSYPGKAFEGKILYVASQSEFTPRNVQSPDERRHQVFAVKIRVANPPNPRERIFKSGMAAEVVLPLVD
jgi:multidrug resistance efflux pump